MLDRGALPRSVVRLEFFYPILFVSLSAISIFSLSSDTSPIATRRQMVVFRARSP
jgi:hypothetical protein